MEKVKGKSVLQEDYMNLGKKTLLKAGVSEAHAEIQMRSLLESDRRGIHTHGIFRLPRYLEQLKNKHINPQPGINKVKESTIVDVIDGDHGLGAVVSHIAMNKTIKKSLKHGVGVVSCRRSNHFGTAAYYAELASSQNQIGIVLTNSSPAIAPTGSKKPLIGNNPWSISVPGEAGQPITLDMANSVVAKGKLRISQQNGECIPLGLALNHKGEPTTDPTEALHGVVLPIGGYKGYGIALMIEILAGILTGADFSVNMVDHDADNKRNVGHLFISLNIEHFMGINQFYHRLDELRDLIKQAPRIDPEQEILLPGEREWRTRENQINTVFLPDNIVNTVSELCSEYEIAVPEFISNDK